MIKFFRHIRKNLLMENKTSKYFKYAIGEILLVVIGILIALSINNWNESKKNIAYESLLLDKMIEQTLADSLLLSNRVSTLQSQDSLYSYYIAINQNTSDSLPDIYYQGFLSPILKLNDGSNLIRNHSENFKQISDLTLREQLMEYTYLATMMDGAIELLNQNLQEYQVPLELEYYERLKGYDDSTSLASLKNILKNPKIEAHFNLLSGLVINVLRQINILREKNIIILEALKTYNITLND